MIEAIQVLHSLLSGAAGPWKSDFGFKQKILVGLATSKAYDSSDRSFILHSRRCIASVRTDDDVMRLMRAF
jgi:hypothetical protein